MTFIRGIAGSAAIGAAMLIGLSAPSAQAAYVVDLTQVGSNVVATGSGAIDTTGLSFQGRDAFTAAMEPISGTIGIGPANGPVPATPVDVYGFTVFSGGFGGGPLQDATSGSGDAVSIADFGGRRVALIVPLGYHSESALSDTATWAGQTFSSLGVTPGTYKWTWGSGADQTFTLVATVPEPSTWALMLIGFAGLGFMGYQSAGLRRTVVDA